MSVYIYVKWLNMPQLHYSGIQHTEYLDYSFLESRKRYNTHVN